MCTWQMFLSWFPFVQWAPKYSLEILGCDIIAGITLALTVIPQGIGYAPLAGLPLQVCIFKFLNLDRFFCIFHYNVVFFWRAWKHQYALPQPWLLEFRQKEMMRFVIRYYLILNFLV